jgi:hypothetical protein
MVVTPIGKMEFAEEDGRQGESMGAYPRKGTGTNMEVEIRKNCDL